MITRRVALGGMLTIYFGRCACATGTPGCWTTGDEAKRIMKTVPTTYSMIQRPAIIEGSGNEMLDRAFTHALVRLGKDFDVLPGFGYYDDSADPNAHATNQKWLDRDDGTVLFGITLLQQLLASNSEHPDALVVAVTAHEYGHIVQYKNGIPARLKGVVKHIELHADFMSGWFAGLRKIANPQYPAVAYAAFANKLGRYNSQAPDFHGTPEDRGGAVEAGFLAATKKRLTLAQAIEAGITHVNGGFKDAPVTTFR